MMKIHQCDEYCHVDDNMSIRLKSISVMKTIHWKSNKSDCLARVRFHNMARYGPLRAGWSPQLMVVSGPNWQQRFLATVVLTVVISKFVPNLKWILKLPIPSSLSFHNSGTPGASSPTDDLFMSFQRLQVATHNFFNREKNDSMNAYSVQHSKS